MILFLAEYWRFCIIVVKVRAVDKRGGKHNDEMEKRLFR